MCCGCLRQAEGRRDTKEAKPRFAPGLFDSSREQQRRDVSHPFFRASTFSFFSAAAAALSTPSRPTCLSLRGATPALFDATRLAVLLVILTICCLVMMLSSLRPRYHHLSSRLARAHGRDWRGDDGPPKRSKLQSTTLTDPKITFY